MPLLNCLCGAIVQASDAEALLASYLAHTAEAHPDVQLSQARRANVVDAIRRTGGWDGRQAALPPDISIEPIAPDRARDYMAYFDGPALCDNPAWASCYCLSYEIPGDPLDFDARPAAQNRAEKLMRIESGQSNGVLAYAGGAVVGWCHAAPRRALLQLDHVEGFECDDPDRTGAFVCFVVAPQYRGQGLAAKLLDGACDMLRAKGLSFAEAYPPKAARSATGGYHGSLKMYEAAGFTHVRDAGRYIVVRKAL